MGSPPLPSYEQGSEFTPPPPPERPRSHRSWAAAPATYLLMGVNCAVFLLMALTGVSPLNPDPDQLVRWGADHAGYVLIGGQWWRIVTAMFVHVGVLHLATNMWCLWNLGLLAEPLMGSFGVIAVYVLTGAAGNLLSIAHNFLRPVQEGGYPVYPVGAGASGAVFGIAGALIVLLKSRRLPVPFEELRKLRRSVMIFAGINLVIPFAVNFGADALHAGLQIDYMAHVGGCACGLLFAVPMVPRIGSPRGEFNVKLRTAIGLIVGILVLFGFFLAQLPK